MTSSALQPSPQVSPYYHPSDAMEFMSDIAEMDEAKPSLFELLSESQLRELLEPSLRYLLAIATQRHPRYLLRILNRYDEVYALLMLLIERHYLKRWGGSFTENFYGLKRVRVTAAQLPRAERFAPALVAESLKLKRADIWKSLFVIVGVPYLKHKLDEAYENYAGGAAVNVLGASYRREEFSETLSAHKKFVFYLKQLLHAIYPSINGVYYFTNLIFNLAYLFDNSAYHSPLDFLIGVRMRRLTEADHRAFEASAVPRNKVINTPFAPTSLFSPSLFSPSIFTRILPKLLDSLKVLLPTSIFILKFLEWWYASDFARQLSAKSAASIELPPPVAVKPPSPREAIPEPGVKELLVKVQEDNSGSCPVCEKEIMNPTAVQTGYVFCYPCVFRWVQDGVGRDGEEKQPRVGRCPVTGVKLLGGTEGLRRLMI